MSSSPHRLKIQGVADARDAPAVQNDVAIVTSAATWCVISALMCTIRQSLPPSVPASKIAGDVERQIDAIVRAELSSSQPRR